MASRAVVFAALSLLMVGAGTAAAGTPALVVEAASGKVLVAERATDPWFPASITKLMTVYVALDQVRQGKTSMGTLLTLSPEAAAEPPSKMGFKPGAQLTLENALKIIMVKSANDISAMIGENLGGSIDGFASMMNDTSRRLGMRDSRWVNPHGLPDERQQTTARDMAILARALISEFPEHHDLFHIGALKLGRKIMRNHNGMLGRYPGADGMKTGFICMGGFNIVASATQNGRRLIAVVMGYPTASSRDLRAANLFDQGFSSLGWGAQTVDQLPPSAAMSAPNIRSFVCGPNKRLPQEDDEPALVALRDGSGASENPISALFAPTAFATASAGAAPALGTRTTLGPRVAFEPIPIWLGASPNTAQEAAIATKPVRTKLVGRAGRDQGGSTAASLSPTVPPSAANEGERVSTLKTRAKPSPARGNAVAGALEPKPAAETKPKLGAVGPGVKPVRAKLGAITLKPTAPIAALEPAVAPRRAAVPKPAIVVQAAKPANIKVSAKPMPKVKPKPVAEKSASAAKKRTAE